MVIVITNFKKASIAITREVDKSACWILLRLIEELFVVMHVGKPFDAGIAVISPVM